MLCELHPLVHFLESSGLVEAADEDASDDDRRSIYMPLESLKVGLSSRAPVVNTDPTHRR